MCMRIKLVIVYTLKDGNCNEFDEISLHIGSKLHILSEVYLVACIF